MAQLLLTLGAVAAALTTIGVFIPRAARQIRRVGHVIDQWIGSPDNPGVIDRLVELERRTGELKPNGGSSLADAVHRIDASTERIERQQTEG